MPKKIVGKLKKIGDVPVIIRQEIKPSPDQPMPQPIYVEGQPGVPGRDGRDAPSIEQLLEAIKKDEQFRNSIIQKLQTGFITGGEGASQQKPTVKYTSITDTTYTIKENQLISGINIFGVSTSAATTVYLPTYAHSSKMVYINDESGDANTNNITIRMEGN